MSLLSISHPEPAYRSISCLISHPVFKLCIIRAPCDVTNCQLLKHTVILWQYLSRFVNYEIALGYTCYVSGNGNSNFELEVVMIYNSDVLTNITVCDQHNLNRIYTLKNDLHSQKKIVE